MTAPATRQQSPEPQDLTIVPLVVRGEVIETDLVEHTSRGAGLRFASPDVTRHLQRLPLTDPADLADLHALPFDEILHFLAEIGRRLDLDTNPHLQQAFRISTTTSGMPRSVLEGVYRGLAGRFAPDLVRDVAERVIGIDYLEGWVPTTLSDGTRFAVRAFGARCVHITAGNLPMPAASTIVRNAITRSDAIIKSPSNDPATASAIARTMCEIDADHPLTRHLSTAYWKGGDAAVEDVLYHPSRTEKVIAWGGEASMRHVRGYIRPGLDLIALDPKLSSTIIGRESLVDDDACRATAVLLARDIGGFNQQGCVNARVVYVQSGTDETGLALLRRFARMVFDEIQALPAQLSTPAERFDPELRAALDGLATSEDWYEVVGSDGGDGSDGAIVVSLQDEPVDFAELLGDRVANLVPMDSLETALDAITAYTQTIGVAPESLKRQLRDRMAFHGAQRIVSLGRAIDFHMATPQDAMEPLRRMLKWIVDE